MTTILFKNRHVKNFEIDGIDHGDYPDYCDAHFSYAEWENGTQLTDSELDELTWDCRDVISEIAVDNFLDAADDAYDHYRDSMYE